MRQQYRGWGVWSRHITRSRYFGAYIRAQINMEYKTKARGQHIETVPRTSFQLPYIV